MAKKKTKKTASAKKKKSGSARGGKSQATALSIGTEIDTFICNIAGLATSLPLIESSLQSTIAAAREKLMTFIDKQKVKAIQKGKGTEFTLQIGPGGQKKLRDVITELKQANRGCRIIPNSFIVSLVSQFDFFLGRILRCLYLTRPGLLNASDRQLTFKQLTELGSVSRAKEYLLEKEIEGVLRKSHPDQFTWLESKFEVPLRKDLDIWPAFVELTERRNLFVHCNGIVSSQYIAVCRDHNVELAPSVKVGVELDVTPEYFEQAYHCIFELGVKLAQVLWRKVTPNDLKAADTSLNGCTYDLLLSEEYKLAKRILDFACETPMKYPNDRSRRMHIINRASAYKWSGGRNVTDGILAKEDWSSCGEEFKLAVAVLSDNYSLAAESMQRIGNSGNVDEQNYTEWPLFKGFRKTDIFRKTYEQVFGKPFVSIEKAPEIDNKVLKGKTLKHKLKSKHSTAPLKTTKNKSVTVKKKKSKVTKKKR